MRRTALAVGGPEARGVVTMDIQRLATVYPELQAGGFSRVDGTVAFYVRINACSAR